MAIFRVSFVYEFANQGWTETFYRESDSPQAATLFSAAQLNKFVQLRTGGVILRAVRSASVDGLRNTYLRKINLSFPPAAGDTPDLTAVCVSVRIPFVGGGGRQLMIRGLGDAQTKRTASGGDNIGEQLQQQLEALMIVISGGTTNMKGRRLIGAGANDLPWIPVVSFAADATNDQWTEVTTSTQGQITAIGQRVYFRNMPLDTFPYLRGQFQVTKFTSATKFSLNIRYREQDAVTPVSNVQFRKVDYTYPALQYTDVFSLATRQTGRPTSPHRGRSPGLRLRR